MVMRKIAAIAAVTLLASPLHALCGGVSFDDQLTALERAEIADKRASTPYASGLVWSATRGADVLTIVGTMHLRDPRLNPIAAAMSGDVQASDIILLEATPSEEAQVMDYMTSNPAILFNTDGPTLPDLLPEDVWQALADSARARGIPPVLAAKMEPWYLMMTLGIPVCAMADLAANKRGLDQMLINDALAHDIPMQALEPFDTIFGIMQDSTRAEQIEMLEMSSINPDLQQQMFVAMLDRYFEGDISGLLKMSEIAARRSINMDPTELAELTAEAEQALLYDRNIAWIPVIELATDKHDIIMIAVGAGHLPGDQGVLKLLENNGWTISPR